MEFKCGISGGPCVRDIVSVENQKRDAISTGDLDKISSKPSVPCINVDSHEGVDVQAI